MSPSEGWHGHRPGWVTIPVAGSVLLLDTHVLLWWLADSDDMSVAHRDAIADRRNGVWVSSATIWEIGIKSCLGKLDAPDDLLDVLGESGFEHLAIRWEHADAAGRLPDRHRDPFDRMLIAQSMIEALTFATDDSTAERYEVATIRLAGSATAPAADRVTQPDDDVAPRWCVVPARVSIEHRCRRVDGPKRSRTHRVRNDENQPRSGTALRPAGVGFVVEDLDVGVGRAQRHRSTGVFSCQVRAEIRGIDRIAVDRLT